MTREDYLRRVELALRDLPWGMRRDLMAELRSHLGELPEATVLETRLGTPEDYAAEMRSAAGLKRRRGPIAFVRARRPRNVILTVLALTALGLAIGAVEWIDSYQPLVFGNSTMEPLNTVQSPVGDGEYVVFHAGRPFRYGFSVLNRGRYTVRILGAPFLFHLPVHARLMMSGPTRNGGMPLPTGPFRPLDLKPGETVNLYLVGRYAEPCQLRNPGTITWYAFPVRFRFLWRTATVDIPLPETFGFVFRKSSACAKR